MFDWARIIIEKYIDFKEVGTWEDCTNDSNQIKLRGKLYSRTIKVRNEDGSIGLYTEMITDVQISQEKL
jgi:hypothetical protein